MYVTLSIGGHGAGQTSNLLQPGGVLGKLLTGSLHLSLLPGLGGLHQRGQGVGGGQEGVTHLE